MPDCNNQKKCSCVPSEMELVTGWCESDGRQFRYQIGNFSKRTRSGWFNADGEPVPPILVERSIYQFLKSLVNEGINVRISPYKMYAIRQMARFDVEPLGTEAAK